MQSAQVFLDDDRGGVFGFGPLVVLDWRHRADTAIVDAADAAVAAAVKTFGPGRQLGYLHRVAEKSPIGRATPEVRNAALQHFERHDAHVVSAAVALEATGFSASVIRSATAGVLLLRPTRIKSRVFNHADEGVRWLATTDIATVDVDAAILAFAALGLIAA